MSNQPISALPLATPTQAEGLARLRTMSSVFSDTPSAANASAVDAATPAQVAPQPLFSKPNGVFQVAQKPTPTPQRTIDPRTLPKAAKDALDKVRENVNPPEKKRAEPSAAPTPGRTKPAAKAAGSATPGKVSKPAASSAPAAPNSSPNAALIHRLQQEVKQSATGIRSIEDMITNPALDPGKSAKAATLWAKLNQVAYESSAGQYGVSRSGEAGSKGTVLKLFNVDQLRSEAKSINAQSAVVYSVLGAVSSFNINTASGLSRKEALWQLPAGFGRDLVNMGLSQVPLDFKSPYLNVLAKGTTGATLTLGTNALSSLHPSTKVKPGLGAGMVLASFVVPAGLAALSEARKAGYAGGTAVEKPTTWEQWMKKNFPETMIIGTGVSMTITPAVMRMNKLLGNPPMSKEAVLKTAAATFLYPAAQKLLAEVTVGAPVAANATAQPRPATQNAGSAKVAAMNNIEAYKRGANPFQQADDTRSPSGNYRAYQDDPVSQIATKVLELQRSLRTDLNAPQVRTNAEAAAVVVKAVNHRPVLSNTDQQRLSSLLRDLNTYGVSFNSEAVRKAATDESVQALKVIGKTLGRLPSTKAASDGRATAKQAASRKAFEKERAFVQQVFSGKLAERPITPDSNPLKTLFDLASSAGALIVKEQPVVGTGLIVIPQLLSAVVDEAPLSKGEISNNLQGFEARMNTVHGGTVKALGVKIPNAQRLSAAQKRVLESAATVALYKQMVDLAATQQASATRLGKNNMPSAYLARAGELFTMYQQLTPAQKKTFAGNVQFVLNEAVKTGNAMTADRYRENYDRSDKTPYGGSHRNGTPQTHHRGPSRVQP
jgi:hypothetical protein